MLRIYRRRNTAVNPERKKNMNNKAIGTALSGAAVGMAVGAAAYMMKDSHHRKPNMKKMKKSAGKVIRTIGGVLDDVTNMVK